MINIEEAKTIFTKIYNNENLSNEIISFIGKNETALNKDIELGCHKNWSSALAKSPMYKLAISFAYLPYIKKIYADEGISDDIFYATFRDIKIWIDDHYDRTKEYGLFEFNWIVNLLNFEVFTVGRLQFQRCTYYRNSPYNANGISLNKGDKVLNLHIPRGGKLDIDECKASIKNGLEFISKHFEGYNVDCVLCHSWLLYPDNIKFMKENSNIIKFAKLFDIVEEFHAPTQTFLWIFGKKITNSKLLIRKKLLGTYIKTSKLPCNSSLHKSAIDYIKKGGCFGDAIGVLIANKI